jgi:hypothetical protein
MEAASMLFKGRGTRDPWWDDGVGAKRTHLRRRITATTAFAAAVAACGLTAAVWLRELAPLAERLLP